MSAASNKKRHPLDPVFKQLLEEQFASPDVALQTEIEVSRLPRTIDALVTVKSTEEQQRIQTTTAFPHFLTHNQVEFKGRNDPLNIAGYHLIQGRMHLLLGQQMIAPEEMTVTIVSARKPIKVLKYAKRLGSPIEPISAGYYQCSGYPSLTLIVINQLPIIPKNYPLLLFTSNKHQFRQVLEQLIVNRHTTYISYAYIVRPRITKEVLTMAGFHHALTRADKQFMAEDIGRELLTFLPPEDLLKVLSLEDRLRGLNPEDRLKGLRPEERKRLLELLLQTSNQEQNGRNDSTTVQK